MNPQEIEQQPWRILSRQNLPQQYPFLSKHAAQSGVTNSGTYRKDGAPPATTVFTEIAHNLSYTPTVLVWRRDATGGIYDDTTNVSMLPYTVHNATGHIESREFAISATVASPKTITIQRTQYLAGAAGDFKSYYRYIILPDEFKPITGF